MECPPCLRPKLWNLQLSGKAIVQRWVQPCAGVPWDPSPLDLGSFCTDLRRLSGIERPSPNLTACLPGTRPRQESPEQTEVPTCVELPLGGEIITGIGQTLVCEIRNATNSWCRIQKRPQKPEIHRGLHWGLRPA